MGLKYTPQPIDTSDVILPEQLNELLEVIAKNVHETWAANRIKDGWEHGESRNDSLRHHPCLIPYEELPEEEREYDRQTAISSFKLIYKLGFKIVPNK